MSSTRTIEDLCAINGQRGQEVPPLGPNLVPNFSEIRKVYDTFFAPGLDQLIETGSTKWFALKGWALLITTPSLPSSASGTMLPEQAASAAQEARMVWACLNLVVSQAQIGNDDDAQKFANRVKALEAILTSESIIRTGSMADFVHQDPEPEADPDVDMSGIPTVANNPLLEKPFSKQMQARSDDFWRLVEEASALPRQVSPEMFDRLLTLLDGREERDIIYSIMFLGAQSNRSRANTNNENNNSRLGSSNPSLSRAARRQQKEQAIRLLETEAAGRATNMVFQNLAGIGLRAFVQ
ncbi:hypothetical protein LTR70_005283 [Exophiala xenobiotica]|uniref:Gag protein n=1 Tax=Lithohypha guttulata TaxID=1690604 RepID=A0ABR0KAL9_9EURO|nr:hypothetical protein LTR24_004913 [Lithohypha guttulata]KAK5318848.1 hypothetical protein LTR70_005283 [Exophiala xenobiotica]